MARKVSLTGTGYDPRRGRETRDPTLEGAMYGDNEPQRGLWAHRVVLDEAGFRDLVAGKVVRLRTADDHDVELILSDIGWGRMEKALVDALKR